MYHLTTGESKMARLTMHLVGLMRAPCPVLQGLPAVRKLIMPVFQVLKDNPTR